MNEPYIICNLRYRFTQYRKDTLPIGGKKVNTKEAFEYYDRDEACDKTIDDSIDTGSAFDYYDYRMGSAGTWNKDGYIEPEQSQTLADTYKPEILWQMVLSFDDDFAVKYGLKSKKNIKNLITKTMPKAIRSMGFDPDNVVWQASYHTNTEHPHCHIAFYEKKLTKGRWMKKDELESFRSKVYTALNMNIALYHKVDRTRAELIETLRRCNISDEMMDTFKKSLNNHKSGINLTKNIKDKLLELEKVLPHKGSMKFNSENIRPYREQILDIVHDIFELEDVNKFYEMYEKTIDEEIETFKEMYGEGVNEYTNSKTGEIKRGCGQGKAEQEEYKRNKISAIETNMANMILQNIIQFRKEMEDAEKKLNNDGPLPNPSSGSTNDGDASNGTFRNSESSNQNYSDSTFNQRNYKTVNPVTYTKRDYNRFIENDISNRAENLIHGSIFEISKGIQEAFYSQLDSKAAMRNAIEVARKENLSRY